MVNTVFETIRRASRRRPGDLLVEQNIANAIALADRALLLRKGLLEGVAQTGAEQVLSSYFGRGAGATSPT